MVSTNRPYQRLQVGQLEALFEQTSEDLEVLRDLVHELGFRKRTRQRHLRLRAAVTARFLELVELEGMETFPWPSTSAPGGNGLLDEGPFQFHQGMLGFLGYRVGKKGKPWDQRRELLDRAYSAPLPFINNSEYLAQWGAARTCRRLQKLAESLAAFARNAKQRSERPVEAISDWEFDLAYLKAHYYRGSVCEFLWPSTAPHKS